MKWLKFLLLSMALTFNSTSWAKDNHEMEVKQLSILAQSGDADAQAKLGVMFLEGDGVEKSATKAEIWLKKAAQNGQVHAQLLLGIIYLQGDDGFKKDVQKSIKYFKQAANMGNSEAQLGLGVIYITEFDSDEDTQKGLEWIKKSAQLGNNDAINFLKDIERN